MLTINVWLLFIGNYLILYSSMHLNFYFENIMFYLYSFIALIFNIIILKKIKKVKINFNSIFVIIFIISIIISILITFNSFEKEGLAKLLYIILCLVFAIDAYLLGMNSDIFTINRKFFFFLCVSSLIIMIIMVLHDIYTLKVMRIATESNPIGTSRAIIIGFLFIFSLYFFKKKYSISFIIYIIGLFFSFVLGTRQIFVSYLLLCFVYSFIPYFKGKTIFPIKILMRNIIFLFLIGIVFLTVFNITQKRKNVDYSKFSYIDFVMNRYSGGIQHEYGSLNLRKKYLFEGFEVIYDKPIFGNFLYDEKMGNFVHQMFIDLYASLGIFPLFIFLLINFIIIIKLSLRKSKKDFFYFFFLLLFFFFTIPSLIITTFLIHPFYYFVLFYLLGIRKEIPCSKDTFRNFTQNNVKI